jgi:hypothetical protein
VTNIDLLHVLALGYHPQGILLITGEETQLADLGIYCPDWNDENIFKILKYVKFISIKLHFCNIETV